MNCIRGVKCVDETNLMSIHLRYWFLLTLVCGSSFVALITFRSADLLFSNNDVTSQEYYADFDASFIIKTNGCTIPFLKHLDKGITKFVYYPKNMKPCRNGSMALLESNKSRISIKMENLYYYGIKNESNLTCCYRPFYRPTMIEDIMSFKVDDRIKYKECIYFSNSIKVNDEFVRVTCIYDGVTVYEQFYLFAPHKPLLIHENKASISQNKTSYNVLLIGIDAVSRLNLYRTMPKTISFIKKNGAIDLAGYNKVGDNTFPNIIPLLLGIKDTELKQTCMPHERASFDNCPFVWEWFKQAGYYTALAEDSARLGTFNYFKSGFTTTPTDYYLHTFISEAEKNAGNNLGMSCFLCMNDKFFFNVLLDYIVDLTTTLKSTKLFGFFWESTMSHDYLNYPMVMDDSYLEMFTKLNASNYLSETIIIFLSDHGIRWGPIRSTKQGRLEERLPFLFMLVPPSFRKNYTQAYNNLKLNANRLTSPFDVHATLIDLINSNNIKDDVIMTRTNESYAQSRGISLFLPLPSNRTCEMAGIDDHWCTCHKGKVLPKGSIEGLEVAGQLIIHLNSLLRKHPECSRLTLAEVLEIKEMMTGIPDATEAGWKEFMVVVRTLPGGGIFEATLRYNRQEWTITGSVSRLNLYGAQSRCIHNYQLKLYCYCN